MYGKRGERQRDMYVGMGMFRDWMEKKEREAMEWEGEEERRMKERERHPLLYEESKWGKQRKRERERDGSEQSGSAMQEREGVCESERGEDGGRGASKHALHVIQSVHMAVYYAFINT